MVSKKNTIYLGSSSVLQNFISCFLSSLYLRKVLKNPTLINRIETNILIYLYSTIKKNILKNFHLYFNI